MKRLSNEVETSFKSFTPQWHGQFQAAMNEASKYEPEFLASYRRLISLQAWRSELLEEMLPAESLGFFVEAQNDGVLSHVMASMGCWRPSLQALRSLIDNVYHTLYYMDHPVELKQWSVSEHRISRIELESYFRLHPLVKNVKVAESGIDLLSNQYAVLNHAVHASSKNFRMTNDTAKLNLSKLDKPTLGKWHSNQRDVLRGANLLLLGLFRDHLSGAAKSNLRKAISLEFTDTLRKAVQSDLKVTLPAA